MVRKPSRGAVNPNCGVKRWQGSSRLGRGRAKPKAARHQEGSPKESGPLPRGSRHILKKLDYRKDKQKKTRILEINPVHLHQHRGSTNFRILVSKKRKQARPQSLEKPQYRATTPSASPTHQPPEQNVGRLQPPHQGRASTRQE